MHYFQDLRRIRNNSPFCGHTHAVPNRYNLSNNLYGSQSQVPSVFFIKEKRVSLSLSIVRAYFESIIFSIHDESFRVSMIPLQHVLACTSDTHFAFVNLHDFSNTSQKTLFTKHVMKCNHAHLSTKTEYVGQSFRRYLLHNNDTAFSNRLLKRHIHRETVRYDDTCRRRSITSL